MAGGPVDCFSRLYQAILVAPRLPATNREGDFVGILGHSRATKNAARISVDDVYQFGLAAGARYNQAPTVSKPSQCVKLYQKSGLFSASYNSLQQLF